VGKAKFSPKQSLIRKLEMFTTGSLFVALLFTGRTVAKAATVGVAPPSPGPAVAGKSDGNELTQRLQKMSEFAQRTKLTVLEFGSKACEPCQQLQEIMGSMKDKFGDTVDFVYVDIDDPANQALQDKYEIGSIPAVFYLDKDGAVVHQTVGYGGKDWFISQVEQLTTRKVVATAAK
jgi:thiol-disulfide isomerase/thioredoxin